MWLVVFVCDDWTVDAQGRPALCRWPVSLDGTSYVFSTPFDDPRYSRPLTNPQKDRVSDEWQAVYEEDRKGSLHYHRLHEPSMDELTGLVAGYDMAFRLVADTQVRTEVRRQVANLADYLAEHGYLLVRPTGGFTALGGTGALPALEFPFERVFRRITGTNFPARVNFEGACQKADVWNCITGPIAWYTIASLPLSAAILMLNPVLAVLGLALPQFENWVTPVDFARAAALTQHSDCFDVANDNQAKEVAGAYLFSLVPARQRFWLWMSGMEHSKGCAGNFPPFIGVTGLDDTDTLIKDSYRAWLPARRQHPELDADCSSVLGAQTAWASAVGVLLGAGTAEEQQAEEQRLVTLLQQRYDEFHGPASSQSRNGGRQRWTGQDDLSVLDLLQDPTDARMYEEPIPALEYMSALAMAWLHATRRAAAGSPVTTPGFPQPPDPRLWPRVTVPKAVVEAAQHPDPGWPMPVPVAAIQGTTTPQVDLDGANLFPATSTPTKPAVPAPVVPAPSSNLRTDRVLIVSERDWDVWTGEVLRNGDDFAVEASGSIWAGVALTGRNGPEGWTNIEYDTKFPLHGVPTAHPFALLGKLRNYFFIGTGIPRTRFIYPEPLALRLRINDDSPGNGNGEFLCRVRVWGPPPPPVAALIVQVQPASIAYGTPVEVTVYVEDSLTHAPVERAALTIQNFDSSGRSFVETHTSNTAFTTTFYSARMKMFDPATRRYYYEIVEPSGVVTAPNYPPRIIPFPFP